MQNEERREKRFQESGNRHFLCLDSPATSMAARAILCDLKQQSSTLSKKDSPPIPKLRTPDSSLSSVKIVLQPRLCTLRSYGATRDGIAKARRDSPESPFFASLADYIDSSRKSHDFEILSGRLAMIVFVTAVTVEIVTGNSLFAKMDLERIAEATGVCVGAVVCAAVFAWFSSARTRVGRIFTLGCNQFVDALIDNLVDGLFYEKDFDDF